MLCLKRHTALAAHTCTCVLYSVCAVLYTYITNLKLHVIRTPIMHSPCTPYIYMTSSTSLCRVEGQGLATITDVVYSTSVAQGSVTNLTGDSQGERQALWKEVREREKDARALCQTEEVLREERTLLTKYACRVFKTGTAAKVQSV